MGAELGGISEDELLAGVKALDARLAGVEGRLGGIVEVYARIARVQEFLDNDVDAPAPAVDTSALAARVSTAEATVAARAMEADLEDPAILAALERKHHTHLSDVSSL